MTSRVVNNPAVLKNLFTLQSGQSMGQIDTFTTSFLNGPVNLPPTTHTSRLQVTYEARETIGVLGRSYDTCRYKTTVAGQEVIGCMWYIFGIGIPARTESRNAAGTVLNRAEIKSLSINGVGV